MSRLKEKLKELGYRIYMETTLYTSKIVVTKTYIKSIDDDNFNLITIRDNKIIDYDGLISEMKKDLEVLKEYDLSS